MGKHDPTTRVTDSQFLRATLTPDGPGTIWLRWERDIAVDSTAAGLSVEAFGPGADWLLGRVGAFTGDGDRPIAVDGAPAALAAALREQRTFRFGASGLLHHDLLPVILQQRITAGEAIKQWHRLCESLGEPAPGPESLVAGLLTPPSPQALHRRPLYQFHPLGIEEARARPMVELARHPAKLFEWADRPPADAYPLLERLPGIGPWTTGTIGATVFGDADAVPVGDFHFPNIVAHFFTGEPRADDDRMLELLAPYAGQRGRVLRAVVGAGRAPSFGPRKRIVPIARM